MNTILAIMTEIRRIKQLISQIKQSFETDDNNIYSSETARKAHESVIDTYQTTLDSLYEQIHDSLRTLNVYTSLEYIMTIPGISKVV